MRYKSAFRPDTRTYGEATSKIIFELLLEMIILWRATRASVKDVKNCEHVVYPCYRFREND